MATTLDDLQHDIIKLRNPTNKDCNLVGNVFRGNFKFTVFKNKSIETSIPIVPQFRYVTAFLWKNKLKNPVPNLNSSYSVSIWNDSEKKFKKEDTIIYGYDENGFPYVGIKNETKGFSHKFALEADIKLDYNNSGLDKSEINTIIIDEFIGKMTIDATIAERLSRVKNKPQQNNNRNNQNHQTEEY